jgi:hypothetical protein
MNTEDYPTARAKASAPCPLSEREKVPLAFAFGATRLSTHRSVRQVKPLCSQHSFLSNAEKIPWPSSRKYSRKILWILALRKKYIAIAFRFAFWYRIIT